MSVVINSNFAATVAANNLAASNESLRKSLNRLSSGSKIVSPSDDAGGLAVSTSLSATVRRQNAVKSNLGNTVSFLQTQDGALKVAGKILDRISELKVLYTDPTKSSDDKANYDTEYQQLKTELTSLGQEKFNGISLFGSSSMNVGTDADGTSAVTIGAVDLLGSSSGGSGSGSMLLSDSFSGSSVDSTKWTATNLFGDSTVTEGGGKVTSMNRGALTSTGDFTGPLQLESSLELIGSHTAASYTWKTDGTHNGSWHWPTNGLQLDFFQESQTVALANVSAGTSVAIPYSLPLNTPMQVKIVDSGNSVSVYLAGASTPSLHLDYDPASLGSNGKVDFLTRDSTYCGTVGASMDYLNISSLSGSGGSNDVGTVANTDSLANLDLATVTAAIGEAATYRAQNGAQQSRLEFASELVTTNHANLEQANSRITDVDVAAESTSLARLNILVQAGTAMLSQANQSSQMALKLLAA